MNPKCRRLQPRCLSVAYSGTGIPLTFCVQHVGIEVGVVRPDNRSQFGVDRDLCEKLGFTQRLKHAGELHQLRHVDDALGSVIESDAKPMLGKRLDRNDISQHGYSKGAIGFSGCCSRARRQSSISSCWCADAHSTTSPSARAATGALPIPSTSQSRRSPSAQRSEHESAAADGRYSSVK